MPLPVDPVWLCVLDPFPCDRLIVIRGKSVAFSDGGRRARGADDFPDTRFGALFTSFAGRSNGGFCHDCSPKRY